MRAIQYFESVARLNSFSKAAESLNVTQSAVSHQIKLLEDYLDEPLFERQGRKLSLTQKGRRYYDEVGDALMSISRASQWFQEGDRGQIKLAMYSSLAVKWLMPNIGAFRQSHPNIELTLEMFSDHPNLSDDVADCFILAYPAGENYHSEKLYNEVIYPVCCHNIWQELESLPLPEGLWQFPLLSVQSMMPSRKKGDDWKQWCDLGGFSLPKEARVHHFSHMILASEAARYEQGITFINPYYMNEIDRQFLIRIPMHELPTGDSIYFVCKKKRARQPEILALSRWLKRLVVDHLGFEPPA
ncbi:LysR family transcriptional regulator [Vibrio aquimaris]|uniref:Glycine cleavage system transcriptional activator n=2 Tax=Vibrio aquimaris TaxID=2587862 RepID=A0A5P9CP65_9VIBR|nr:Glycine cleavage system transcriptional activator [Vibrio aquimaris]